MGAFSYKSKQTEIFGQLGRRTTNQGIQRTIVQKKYPLLICFLRQTYEEIIDGL